MTVCTYLKLLNRVGFLSQLYEMLKSKKEIQNGRFRSGSGLSGTLALVIEFCGKNTYRILYMKNSAIMLEIVERFWLMSVR